jgi:hypothetical protein
MIGRLPRRLRGGWSVAIGLLWLISVLVVAWNMANEEDAADQALLLATILGLTLGVVLVNQHHSGWIFAVPAVAFLAALATSALTPDWVTTRPRFTVFAEQSFILYLVVLGGPVLASALVAAVWRLVFRLLDARSARR